MECDILNFNTTQTILWVTYGVLYGFALNIVFAIPGLLSLSSSQLAWNPNLINLFLGMLFSIFDNLSHAALIEEVIFRGFLWGYLRNLNWSEKRIWLVQGSVFILFHINSNVRLYTLLVTIPLTGLIFGYLAWKSKSLTPSIVSHAVFNAKATVIF